MSAHRAALLSAIRECEGALHQARLAQLERRLCEQGEEAESILKAFGLLSRPFPEATAFLLEVDVRTGDTQFKLTTAGARWRASADRIVEQLRAAVDGGLAPRSGRGSAKSAPAPGRIRVYVGPEVRHGFADVDVGVRDTTRDIYNALRRDERFALVPSMEGPDVDVALVIQGRFLGEAEGVIAVPVGNTAWGVGVGKKRIIRATLRAGEYEYAFLVGASNWTASARAVVENFRSWVAANEPLLRKRAAERQ